MSNMPSVSDELIAKVKSEIARIRRGKRGKHERPHKLVMLLSVIELADRGLLESNKIYLRKPLLSIFESIFLLVQRDDDLCQPGPPFFHLRSSGFGFHKVKPGRENVYAKLTTTGGGLGMIENNTTYLEPVMNF